MVGRKGVNIDELREKYEVKIHVNDNVAYIEGKRDALLRLQQEKKKEIPGRPKATT